MNLDNFADILLQQMPDALVVSDEAGIIQLWNNGAQRIFGFTTSEAIGQPLDIIIPENLRARHGNGYRETMRTGITKYAAGELLAVPALCKDGKRISIQFSILPLADPDGKWIGVAAIMRDVTAEFTKRRELEKSVSEYRRMARANKA